MRKYQLLEQLSSGHACDTCGVPIPAGATPTYEETARVAYALRVGQVINSGPKCPAYAMGLGMLRIMIHVGLNEARAAGDAGRVARLTRLAQLHDLPAQARRGTDWLAEPGRPI